MSFCSGVTLLSLLCGWDFSDAICRPHCGFLPPMASYGVSYACFSPLEMPSP